MMYLNLIIVFITLHLTLCFSQLIEDNHKKIQDDPKLYYEEPIKNEPEVESKDANSTSSANSESQNEIDFQELEYLCHHFYKDEFVISAQVQESGCRLECIFLQSSGTHGSNFFDTSVTKLHSINEGYACDPEIESFKCVNGSCIEPPETGKAAIAIYNASLPSKDLEIEGQESDPFVKVFLDQKYLMKTKTLENNNFPVWKQIFMSPLMTSDSQITFIVMDRDTNGEEMLLTVQTTVDLVMALDKNSTVVCAPESSPNYLCYSIAWFPGI